MTKIALTLAATLLAATTMTNAAQAGGIRLGFGLPLGSFVANSFAPSSRFDGGSRGYERKCDRRGGGAEASARRLAAVRAARAENSGRAAQAARAAKIETAQRAEARARKANVAAVAAKQEARSAEIKTAKLENKAVATDAAPTIFVPTTPAPVAAAETSSTAVQTSSAVEIAPVGEINDAVRIAAPKAEKLKQTASVETPRSVAVAAAEKTEIKTTPDDGKKVCRRFSPAIAGMVDVPCE